MQKQIAALYVRLSQEDRNKLSRDDESESIINQQNILTDYCKRNGFEIYDIYKDEDFSGSDRERPEFNRMISDARKKRFNTIICKTQSRFARDMELIEKYVNGLFPIWGIRFISVVDNGDTMNRANRKTRQIFALTDQWYLEDLSENIRATLSNKRRQGLWVGAFAPFGYIKDPQNKNRLIIDDEAANTVRYIFRLYLNGMGVTSIARKLNAENITNPATYKKQHEQSFQNIHRDCSDMWHTYSVQRILSNPVYIGNTVQGSQEKVSCKSIKQRQKPSSEWDIVENTHEAIISREVWDKAQKLRKEKPKSGKTGKPNVLAGKVRCLDCGGSMRVYYSGGKRYFRCNTAFVDKSRCGGMTISETVLHREIICKLKTILEKYLDKNMLSEFTNTQSEYSERHLKPETLNSELAKLNNRLNSIYYDKLDGLITKEEYLSLKKRFSEEIKTVKSELSHIPNNTPNLNQLKTISKLDYLTAQTLIEKIEIGGSRNNRVINIYWNF